ncbi:uncharacterized protein IAS62_000996 [Cryptococcus decagattii]|uniref:Histone H1 n=1 Tax=Cryptococcus decagattii TaxID=1859122 RepID=A0ABZ2AMD3_9TREE
MAPVKKTAATPRKATTHPTFLSMIQECISQNKGDARKGVSRPTIKKFLADKYKLDMSSPANISNLSNAIKRGALKGQLTLPSGIAGRVKAGTKKSAIGKENVAPKKAIFAKKAASNETRKHAPKKASTANAAVKAVPAKKPAAKKTAHPVKKTSAPKKAHAAKDAVAAPEKAAPKKKAVPKKATA